MHRPRLAQPRATAAILAVLLTLACDDPAPVDAGVDQPWTRQFTFGSTAINSGVIPTVQDGVSADYLADYVVQDALPNVDMEAFSTHVYLPAGADHFAEIRDVSVTAGRIDGTRTPNFFLQAGYVQSAQLGGESYEVHELVGIFVGAPALRPDNFANVVFEFDVEYVDPAGAVVHRGSKTIEIYKR